MAAATQAELLYKDALHNRQIALARTHPAFFLHHVHCVDSRSGEIFEFELLTPEEAEEIDSCARGHGFDTAERETPIGQKDWHWQRKYLDWIIANDLTCTLKGRQLGVTWVWAGLALQY